MLLCKPIFILPILYITHLLFNHSSVITSIISTRMTMSVAFTSHAVIESIVTSPKFQLYSCLSYFMILFGLILFNTPKAKPKLSEKRYRKYTRWKKHFKMHYKIYQCKYNKIIWYKISTFFYSKIFQKKNLTSQENYLQF